MKLLALHGEVFCDTNGCLYRVVDNVIESDWFGPVHPEYQSEYENWYGISIRMSESIGMLLRGVMAVGVKKLEFIPGGEDTFEKSWGALSSELREGYKFMGERLIIAIRILPP